MNATIANLHIPFDINGQNLGIAFAGYVILMRLLRYRGRDALQRKYRYDTKDSLKNMSLDDAFEIQKYLFIVLAVY